MWPNRSARRRSSDSVPTRPAGTHPCARRPGPCVCQGEQVRRRQLLIGAAAGVAAGVAAPFAERWLSADPVAPHGVRLDTTADLSTKLLASSPMPVFGPPGRVGSRDVTVDAAHTFQPFLGVGAALTDAAAYVLTQYMT